MYQFNNRNRKNFNNNSRRPNHFGSFHQPRRAPASKLGRDHSIFIKKATFDVNSTNYNIIHKFSDFNLTEVLYKNIIDKGYTEPTPIQDLAIKPILENKDLIGLANTGTGKTAAFLIPIIEKILNNHQERAIIIVPTRELAQQIIDEVREFAKNTNIFPALIIGGANIKRQINNLRQNPNIVIGTPGRIKDLIQKRYLHLDRFSIFVLDEVDLMVDIGFIADIKFFVSFLPRNRQSLFFSATIPDKIKDTLNSFVTDPITVSAKVTETSGNIDQDIIKTISQDKKLDQLHDLLIQDGFEKVLIFGRTKHGVEKLHKQLEYRGFKVGAIHGNKKQGHRIRTLESFKRSEIQILLATDVASRGLDIANVTHVINYDLPETYDDYVHRIGRTGRADKKGVALTFV